MRPEAKATRLTSRSERFGAIVPRRRVRRAWRAALVAACVLLGAHVGLSGAWAASTKTARVTYLAGGSVYVDAGHLDGLGLGDTLVVLRGAAEVSRLRVVYVSSRRASCDTFSVREAPVVGDLARYTPRAVVDGSAGGAIAAAAPVDSAALGAVIADSAPAPSPASRLRGRAGVRTLVVHGSGGGYTQPAIDLRLDQRDAGGRFDFALDLRGRQTLTSGTNPGGSDHGSARVYRLSGTVHDQAGAWRITAGRQTAASLASVSLFDGVLGEARLGSTTVRLFSGTQPEPTDMGLSSEILELGGGVEWRTPASSMARRAAAGFGAVTSRHGGEPNRDFLFFQGFYSDPRVHVSAAQELDLGRGWRADAGEPALGFTSTFASARVTVSRLVDLNAGYDNRRNVRLWRDRETPADAFDDRYRQGAWLGASYRPRPWLRAWGDVRMRDHGADDRTWTESGVLEVSRLTRYFLTLRARASRVDGAASDARLYSLGLGADPVGGLHAEVTAGQRLVRELALGFEERVSWVSLEADWAVGRTWYVSGSYERTRGGPETIHQEYAGLSRRF